MPDGDNELTRLVQLEFFLFADGLFVTAAGPGYSRLLGAEVATIGGLSASTSPAADHPPGALVRAGTRAPRRPH